MHRLQVGIDPAQNSCVAKVVDDRGEVIGRKIHFRPDRPGLTHLLKQVEARGPGVAQHFFVEASGYLWYAPAALLQEAGAAVSLVNPSYTKAQRRCSTPHAKSDGADAEAIARVVFNRGVKALHPADVPEGDRLNLRLLTRHRATLQQDATSIKLRLLAWQGLTLPGLTELLGRDFSELSREFLTRYPVIGKILKHGKGRLRRFFQNHGAREVDETTLEAIFELAKQAYSPRDLDDELVALQFGIELQRLALLEKQIRALDKQIEKLLPKCDPQALALSLPGFGGVLAAIMVAEAGSDLSRFPTVKQFASWTGVVARASGTAGRHVEGLPITKAGRSIVKWALYMAAKSAINTDAEMRAFYDRLKADGKHHNTALVAVAHKLARIYYTVMTERRPFQARVPKTELDPIDIA